LNGQLFFGKYISKISSVIKESNSKEIVSASSEMVGKILIDPIKGILEYRFEK
jgi:hypothetical protein